MKTIKKLCGLFLAFTMILSAVIPTIAHAAEKDDIPTKVRLFRGWEERAIQIELADTTQAIANIKTDNKNLFAMLTGSESVLTQEEGVVNAAETKNSFTIGLYSKKDGTYTVSFDIIDKNKKKVEAKKIKVYAYGSPVKSITFDGKQPNGNELSGNSAKVKVTLLSGNTIKKLQYGVYKIKEENNETNSDIAYTTFKNNGKVTFGTKAYTYSHDSSYENDGYVRKQKYFYTSMNCPTYISITYYDQYTKQNETYEEYYYKLLE